MADKLEQKRRLKTLTFGDLKVGDMFIDFPTDGDNSGHGGFKTGYVLFKKIESKILKEDGIVLKTPLISFKAMRVSSRRFSSIPDSMEVIKIV